MAPIRFNADTVIAVTKALYDSSHDEQIPGDAFLQKRPNAKTSRTLAKRIKDAVLLSGHKDRQAAALREGLRLSLGIAGLQLQARVGLAAIAAEHL